MTTNQCVIIHIINQVNKKWEKLGNKPVGITKEEFSFFVPTTINYQDIPKTVDEIIILRNKIRGRDKKEQIKIKREYFTKKTKDFFQDDKNLTINFNNLKDYGDNAIRYFKITRFFYIRGGGFYIDLEPRRNVEIKSLLEYSNAEGIKFKDLDEYLEYMDSDIVYPWETPEKVNKIVLNLRENISQLNSSLEKPMDLNLNLIEKDITPLSVGELKELASELRKHRKEIQEYKDHLELVDAGNFEVIIKELEEIRKSDKIHSIHLEYLTTMCLHAINDAVKIQPNYPVGDDNQPTFTAPANVPDIECFYESFNLVCEVTMLTSRSQWINEGQPVMRHLRDFENKHLGENLCLFIAPQIHRDTFNTFIMSNKFAYEGKKQKIIPLSITQFLKFLKKVLAKKKENKPITYQEFNEILEKLYNISLNVADLGEWAEKSNVLLDNYLSSGVLA